MKAPITLALDIGTSSVRAALYDGDANVLPRTSVKIERTLTSTADGGAEIDADIAFDQVLVAIDAVLEKTKNLIVEIECVASCSFWHSLVGVDANGKPTTKVLSWADRRSREYSRVLKERFDEATIHDRTGAHFHSSFWPAKLLSFRRENTAIFEKTSMWLSLSDYIALKLFGRPVTSVSMASGTGIFDQRKCVWDNELSKFLKVKTSALPVIAADGETFRLNRKFAARWPRLKNAAWFPSVADGAADNVGSGCVTKDKAALMVGTSAALRIIYQGEPPEQIPDGLWCYRVDRKRVIVGGALSDGGNLYALIKRRFKLSGNIDQLIAERDAADGLVVIPFFHGERSTGYDEDARGAIIGMTAEHDGIDVLRAAMEGVAFRLADIFERLSTVADIHEIVASGGALRDSPVWTQIIADVLGRDLTLNDAQESSSRGAVLLALESLGKIESIERSQT
ncbi:MAG: gluconokinase [Pyrinomonadaceae bacterium]|nr:gluconokinase [Pyrinomonadaceae bacterium]